MNRAVIFLTIVIFIAITGVLMINKNTSSPADLTALTVTPSPVLAASTAPQQDTTLSSNSDSISPSTSPSVSPSISPSTSPSPSAAENTKASSAVIKTSKGEIDVQLYPDDAPKTVANFVQKAKSDFYKNLTFHRVEDWVVQGGDPKGDGTGGNDFVTEVNKHPFVVGSLGIAGHQGEGGIISNDAQFFITKKDSQFLNGQYTNFGIVTKGMDVVNKMAIGDKILGITVQ